MKASGLLWLSLMLLAPVAWAKRVWALPFLTVLAPSERYYKGKAVRHTPPALAGGAREKLTQWAQQVVLQVRRWQVEVTFHEVRTHLGVETQRQWADLSILRITPALLGLFSIVTLLANCHARKQKLPVQQTVRYQKKLPTFSDALALGKETLLLQHYFPTSLFRIHVRKPHRLRPIYHYSRSLHAVSRLSFG